MVASGAAKTNIRHMFEAFQSINSNYSPLANLHSNDLKCAQCTQIQILLVQPMFQHADATVLELNGSAALERVQVAIRGQAQWVPEAQRCLSRVIGVIGVIYCVKLSCQVSSPQF